MKRIISLVLVAVMMLAAIPLSAAADSAAYDLVIDVPEAYKAGDIINVKVTITDIQLESGISFINFIIRYDNTGLSVNSETRALNCMEEFYAWEDLSRINGSSDTGTFVPANDGIITIDIGDGGGTGADWHNIVAGEEIVLNLSFTALADASENAKIRVDGSETFAGVFDESKDNPLGYNEYTGLGTNTVIEETIEYNENAVEGGHIPGGAATCTTAQYCTGCGEVITAALGHSYTDKVTEPTCTEQGYTTHVCGTCGDTVVDTYVDANGHSEYTKAVAATCTEQGYTEHFCYNCDYYFVDNYIEPSHDEFTVVTDPTCTEQGYTTHYCYYCDHSYVDTYVDANGHNEYTIVTDPTCTEQGYTEHYCNECDYHVVDTYVDANGHTDGEWVIITEAAYEKEGLKELHCADCEEVIDSEVIPALQYQRGDINGDGKINATDYIMLKRIILGSLDPATLKEGAEDRANINKDGRLNATDYVMLKRAILGKYTIVQ